MSGLRRFAVSALCGAAFLLGSVAHAAVAVPLFKEYRHGDSMAEFAQQEEAYEDCSELFNLPGALCRKTPETFFTFDDWLLLLAGNGDRLQTVTLVREGTENDLAVAAASLLKSGYMVVAIDNGQSLVFDLFETVNVQKNRDIAGAVTKAEQALLGEPPVHIGYTFFNLNDEDRRLSRSKSTADFLTNARPDLRAVELRWIQEDGSSLLTLIFRAVKQSQIDLLNSGVREEF